MDHMFNLTAVISLDESIVLYTINLLSEESLQISLRRLSGEP